MREKNPEYTYKCYVINQNLILGFRIVFILNDLVREV